MKVLQFICYVHYDKFLCLFFRFIGQLFELTNQKVDSFRIIDILKDEKTKLQRENVKLQNQLSLKRKKSVFDNNTNHNKYLFKF